MTTFTYDHTKPSIFEALGMNEETFKTDMEAITSYLENLSKLTKGSQLIEMLDKAHSELSERQFIILVGTYLINIENQIKTGLLNTIMKALLPSNPNETAPSDKKVH